MGLFVDEIEMISNHLFACLFRVSLTYTAQSSGKTDWQPGSSAIAALYGIESSRSCIEDKHYGFNDPQNSQHFQTLHNFADRSTLPTTDETPHQKLN